MLQVLMLLPEAILNSKRDAIDEGPFLGTCWPHWVSLQGQTLAVRHFYFTKVALQVDKGRSRSKEITKRSKSRATYIALLGTWG